MSSIEYAALIAIPVLLVAGCATQPVPAPVVKSTCLPLRAYTPQEQKELAQALQALPPDAVLARAMLDYEAMRDADRACMDGH